LDTLGDASGCRNFIADILVAKKGNQDKSEQIAVEENNQGTRCYLTMMALMRPASRALSWLWNPNATEGSVASDGRDTERESSCALSQ